MWKMVERDSTRVSMNPLQNRFIVVRTDEQFADAEFPLYTGYDMGVWENTGDKNHLRKLQ